MRRCASLVAYTLAVGLTCHLVQTSAAEPAPATTPSATAEKTTERHAPLPDHFGKLGITDDQRTRLYTVQDSYEDRLEKLRQELKQLIRERDKRMEYLLTDGQKLRLKELREEAKLKAEEKAKAAEKQ